MGVTERLLVQIHDLQAKNRQLEQEADTLSKIIAGDEDGKFFCPCVVYKATNDENFIMGNCHIPEGLKFPLLFTHAPYKCWRELAKRIVEAEK